nr:EOG090X0G6M [Chydorus sphaericus]
MELMSEEVAFLITQQVVHVVQHEDLNSPAPTSAQEDWEKLCDASFSEQATLYKEERVVHVMKLADRIIAGKKRAQRDNDGIIDEKAALQKEIDKIPDMSRDTMMIQLCTRPHWKSTATPFDFDIKPSVKSFVFEDLWKKGYYITSGQKFGGDFLVYPGDPLKFHSHYIAVCLEEYQPLTPKFLICHGRLGTNVKKTVLLCSVNDQGVVNYQSLNWNGK